VREQLADLGDVLERGPTCTGARDHDHVCLARPRLPVKAEVLAHQPLDPVPEDGVADGACDRQAETTTGCRAACDDDLEAPATGAPAVTEDTPVVGRIPDAIVP
jgi:hypothetical protein